MLCSTTAHDEGQPTSCRGLSAAVDMPKAVTSQRAACRTVPAFLQQQHHCTTPSSHMQRPAVVYECVACLCACSWSPLPAACRSPAATSLVWSSGCGSGWQARLVPTRVTPSQHTAAVSGLVLSCWHVARLRNACSASGTGQCRIQHGAAADHKSCQQPVCLLFWYTLVLLLAVNVDAQALLLSLAGAASSAGTGGPGSGRRKAFASSLCSSRAAILSAAGTSPVSHYVASGGSGRGKKKGGGNQQAMAYSTAPGGKQRSVLRGWASIVRTPSSAALAGWSAAVWQQQQMRAAAGGHLC